jgi:two-component system, LytTR family, response regulator
MINAVIIDDERLARQELKRLLEVHSDVDIVSEFGDADEAIAYLKDNQPDLIFLDIQMPGKDGFQFLEALERVPNVIFVTAYDEYALKAFQVSAMDYLLKPVEENRLQEALNKVREEISNEKETEKQKDDPKGVLDGNDQIFIKDGDKCWFVELKNVRLFESEGNYVRVYFDKSKPLILKSLNNLERRLSDKDFFRANRKHIINLKQVAKIESWFNGGLLVTLKDEKAIEISRRQAVKLKDRMIL